VLTLSPPRSFRALLVWPRFSQSLSFWQATTESSATRAHLPPLGLLTVAGLCPSHWHLRLVDEALEPVSDKDLAWCDLLMISATESQSLAVEKLLHRARDAGRRSIIGGPYASSHTRHLTELADHVVVGEVDEHFFDLAEALEAGQAVTVYDFPHRPDLALTPIPRYELLKLSQYSAMPLQTARGLAAGRAKTPQQLLRELDALRETGWKGEVFLVDENLAENPTRAAEISGQLKLWQERHGHPIYFSGQASSQVAHSPGLIEAMVEANFHSIFLNLESSLISSGSSSLARSGVNSVGTLLSQGLWVRGAFISRSADYATEICLSWIEEASLPWVDFPLTPDSCPLVERLYQPQAYLRRILRSLEMWRPRSPQTPSGFAWTSTLQRVLSCLWNFGPGADFRGPLGKAFLTTLARWCSDPIRLYHGLGSLISSRHVISQAHSQMARCRAAEKQDPALPVPA